MFISVIDKERLLRTGFIYVSFSMFLGLFGAIYEIFSHGVYSYFMLYAFAPTLCLGAFPMLLFGLIKNRLQFSTPILYIYHSGIATLSTAMVVKGVLDIFGTTNKLMIIYYVAAAVELMFSVLMFLIINIMVPVKADEKTGKE